MPKNLRLKYYPQKPSKTLYLASLIAILLVFSNPVLGLALKSAQCDLPPMATYDLLSEPLKFKGRRVSLEGEFYSFSTLPLDYKEAMRSSKDYVGIVIARPDHKKIPLVELKMAVPIKLFKDDEVLSGLEHGDMIRVEGKVFAVALGEPWLDVSELRIKEKIAKDEDGEEEEPSDQ